MSPRHVRSLATFAAILVVLAAPPVVRSALAHRAESDPRASAREHFHRGTQLQEQHEYARAIDEYQLAYALVPLAELLFDIAQCYRLEGDAANAVTYYRRYVDADPTGRGTSEALRHIDELTRATAPQLPSSEPPKPAEGPAQVVGSSPGKPDPSPAAASQDVVKKAPVKRSPGLRSFRLIGIAGVGTGVVAAGLGTWFALEVNRLENDIENTPKWSAGYNQKIKDGDRAETRMIVAFAAGGALFVGGALTYWLAREPSEPVLQVAPLVGAVNGLGLTGTF